LAQFMPGVRKAIAFDLPRNRLALGRQRELARQLKAEGYGTALVMSRKWKAALAPFLAGIPERTGIFGEGRLLLLNDIRWDEKKHARMIDQSCALALPPNADLSENWPLPQLVVTHEARDEWQARMSVTPDRYAVALAPGSVGEAKRWPIAHYADLAKAITRDGTEVWVIGGPDEKPFAGEIVRHAGEGVRDFAGGALRDAVIALGAARAVVANDSGLLHVAAAIGTPAIGLFGPTDPKMWAPINPVADIVLHEPKLDCQHCGEYVCPLQHHRCLREVSPMRVLDSVRRALEWGATELRG
jgi:heptosyltransferase-2